MLNRMGHGAAQLRFGSMLLTIEVATRSPGCICDVSRHEPHVGRRASLCRPVRGVHRDQIAVPVAYRG